MRSEIPAVQMQIASQYDSSQVVVFGLTRKETPLSWLQSYRQSLGLTFDLLYNADDVFTGFGIRSVPGYVLIDRLGQIRWQAEGYYYYRMNEIRNRINTILNEKQEKASQSWMTAEF